MDIIIAVMVGAVAGNFLYQAANDKDWFAAIDRSLFQAVALGAVAFFQWANLP